MTFVKNLKKFYSYLRKYKREWIFILIFSAFNTIFFVVNPSLIGGIVNSIHVPSVVIINLILLGLFSILSTVFNILISKFYLRLSTGVIKDLRVKMCNAFLNYNMTTHYNQGQGVLINRINEDTKNVVVSINNIKESFFYALKGLGILGYICFVNIFFCMYYIVTTALSIFIRYKGVLKQIRLKKQLLEKNDENTTLIGELLKGMKEIKTLNLKNVFMKKSQDSIEKIQSMEYESTFSYELYFKLADFLESIFLGVMILFSMFLIQKNWLNVANFVVIFMYRDSIFMFSSKFSKFVSSFLDFNLSCDRIFKVLDEKVYQREHFGKKSIQNCQGKISLNQVSYESNHKQILSSISLQIQPNSFVGIIGKSGAGKTTFLQLLDKFYIPTAGKISFDHVNYLDLDEKCFRKCVSLASQSPYLFNLSIKENLQIVKEDLTQEELENVLDKVALKEFVDSLPLKENTILGEDGVKISKGEGQRIALARCLLLNTPIILLDEITSNLDLQTSHKILNTIKELKGKHTIIMVAHKLEMLEFCDRILLLKQGQLVADENVQKIKKNPFYLEYLEELGEEK